jgi:hypothetical protein
MLAAAACSGGGGSSSGNGVADPNQTGGQDTPSSGGYDIPPSDFDTPPGPDTPPGDDSPGSASGDVPGGTCAKLCNAFFANQCACPGDDAGACTASCNAALPHFGPCIDQTNSLIECMIRSPSFNDCNVFRGSVEAGDFHECTVQAVNFAHCFQLNQFDVDELADGAEGGLGDCGAGGAGDDGGGKGANGQGPPPPRAVGGTGGAPQGTGGMAGSGMAGGGMAGSGV